MSERSLLMPNTWNPKARAAAAGGVALGLALTLGGCGGPKNPKLIGEASISCADKDIGMPTINITNSRDKAKAKEIALKTERGLCATAREVGMKAIELYEKREDHKKQFDLKGEATGKGAKKYELTIDEVEKKNPGTTLSVTLETTDAGGDSDNKVLKAGKITGVEVKQGSTNRAEISFSSGRWSMDADAETHGIGLEHDWPMVTDYGLITDLDKAHEFATNGADITSAINDTSSPFVRAA